MINFIDENGKQHSAIVECKKTKGVNGEKSLTGTIYTNDEILEGIGRGWRLQFENENYCLTYANPIDEGTRIVVEFDAVHEFFFDMSKSVVYAELNGSNTATAYLDFIFNGSGYEYHLEVTIPAFEKESFGMKNRLDLFKDFVSSTGVEFSVSGKIVRILEKVGSNLSTIVKKGFNLNELRIEKNIGNFITYLKGYGAYNGPEDQTKGRLEVEYLSPLASIYGKLEGDPIVDERYKNTASLTTRLKNEIESSYGISVDIDMEDLTKAGYEYDQPHEGDYIMAINKDLGFEQKIRIMSYTTSYDTEGNVIDHDVSCGSDNLVSQVTKSDNDFRKNVQAGLENAVNTANQAWISADGKNKVFTGTDEPVATNKGDIWYQIDGEKTIMKFWNGFEWQEFIDPKAVQQAAENAEAVGNAAQAAADNAKKIGEAAQIAADNAKKIGEDAQKVGDQAKQAGEAAQAAADEAKQVADEAKTAGQNAKYIANQASTNAQTALDNANNAVDKASQASQKADNSAAMASDAKNQAATAASNASTALTNAQNAINQVTQIGSDLEDTNGQVSTLTDNLNGFKQTVYTKTQTDTKISAVQSDINGFKTSVSNTYATKSEIQGIKAGVRNYICEVAWTTKGYLATNGSVTNSNDNRVSRFIDVDASKAWIFQQFESATSGSVYVAFYDTNKNLVGSRVTLADGQTGTTANNAVYMRLSTPYKDTFGGRYKFEFGTVKSDWTQAPEDTQLIYTNLQTQVDQTANAVSNKADKTTVDQILGRVDTAEGNITTMAGQINLKANKSTVDTITNRVSATEASLSLQDGKITALTSKTDGHTTQIGNLKSSYDGMSSTIATVQSNVNNLVMGNRNLIVKANVINNSWLSSTDATPQYGNNTMRTGRISVYQGNKYVIQNYETASSAFRIFEFDSAGKMIGTNAYSWRTKYTPSPNARMIEVNFDVQGGKYTKNAYIAESSTYSTWSPAPEDLATVEQMSSINQTISSIRSTVQNKADITQITQLSNQITSVVGSVGKTNLVVDSDFDDFRGSWFVSKNTGSADFFSPGYDGSGKRKLVTFNYSGFTSNTWSFVKSTPVAINGKNKISASVDLWVNTNSDAIAMQIEFSDSSGNIISSSPMNYGGATLLNQWQSIIINNASVPSNASTVRMVIFAVKNGNFNITQPMMNVGSEVGYYVSYAASQSQITQLSNRMNFRITNSDGSITQIDLANKVISLSGEQVNITGNTYISNGVIKTANIADLAVSTAKIANLAVNEGKIANLAVTNAKIGDLAVNNAKIANLAVSTAKIADLAVTDAKISSLTANKLTAGTIDANVITVKNINASNIISGTIDANVITVKNISASNITGGTMTADRINGGTINGGNVNIINLNASNITSGTISGTNLSINLATGVVNFQKGVIQKTDGTFKIDITNGSIGSTYDVSTVKYGFSLNKGSIEMTKNSSAIGKLGWGTSDSIFGYGIVSSDFSSSQTAIGQQQYVGTRLFFLNDSPTNSGSSTYINSGGIVKISAGTLYKDTTLSTTPTLCPEIAIGDISGTKSLVRAAADTISLQANKVNLYGPTSISKNLNVSGDTNLFGDVNIYGTVKGKLVPSSNSSIGDLNFIWKPTATSYVELVSLGNTYGINVWSSDRNLKKNISTQNDSALSVVDQLKIKQFDWKEGGKHVDFGLIAQEVETVLPDAVFSVTQPSGEQRRQLKSEAFVPLLLKSIQELKQEIEMLKTKVA